MEPTVVLMLEGMSAHAPVLPSMIDIAKSARMRDAMLDDMARLTNSAQFDKAIQEASAAMVAGGLIDSDYAAVIAALTALRAALPLRQTVAQRVPSMAAAWSEAGQSRFKPHIRKTMPTEKKAEYVQRRRELAASGLMPRQLAANFTTGQIAALAVVAQEVQKFGRCTLVIEKIAALAGICHATVRRALARAAKLGLVAIAYRERRGAPSLSNIVTVLSATWRDWIKRRSAGRGQSLQQMLRKIAEKTVGPLFLGMPGLKCNPTPSTININGNRPTADYSISFNFDNGTARGSPKSVPI